MIGYVTVGSNDIARSKRFYQTFLPTLGYGLEEGPEGLSYALPVAPHEIPTSPEFYVKPPYNEQQASNGNGAMVAFEANNQQKVRDLHAAALAAGGTNEGHPGFRPDYSAHFYVGYLRDPDGNKISLYSSRLDESGRDD